MERNILFIDDQEDILRILEREFNRRAEYKVFTAVNSRNALDVLAEERIDLVITDVRIGEENGFVLLKQIRETYSRLGVMMMTAYRSPGYRQQAEQLGVTFFIEKPFSVATLIQAVEAFFDKQPEAALPSPEPAQAEAFGADANAMSHFKIVDLIQLFCLNGRKVVISAHFPGHPTEGLIYIREGRVWDVKFGALEGEGAFYRMLALGEPQLGIRNSEEEDLPQTVTVGWEYLLMEAARAADEAQMARDEGEKASQENEKKDPFANFWKTARLTKTDTLRVPN